MNEIVVHTELLTNKSTLKSESVAFSIKSFGQTSCIVLTDITYIVLFLSYKFVL